MNNSLFPNGITVRRKDCEVKLRGRSSNEITQNIFVRRAANARKVSLSRLDLIVLSVFFNLWLISLFGNKLNSHKKLLNTDC